MSTVQRDSHPSCDRAEILSRFDREARSVGYDPDLDLVSLDITVNLEAAGVSVRSLRDCSSTGHR